MKAWAFLSSGFGNNRESPEKSKSNCTLKTMKGCTMKWKCTFEQIGEMLRLFLFLCHLLMVFGVLSLPALIGRGRGFLGCRRNRNQNHHPAQGSFITQRRSCRSFENIFSTKKIFCHWPVTAAVTAQSFLLVLQNLLSASLTWTPPAGGGIRTTDKSKSLKKT